MCLINFMPRYFFSIVNEVFCFIIYLNIILFSLMEDFHFCIFIL